MDDLFGRLEFERNFWNAHRGALARALAPIEQIAVVFRGHRNRIFGFGSALPFHQRGGVAACAALAKVRAPKVTFL